MDKYIQLSPGVWKCTTHNKFFADGRACPLCLVPSVDRNLEIKKLSDEGLSQRVIASRLGISQKQVWRTLRRFVSGPVSERFHAFSIKFNAVIDYDAVDGREFWMKQTSYKRLDFEDFIVKVFHKSILVSFRKEKNIYDMKCSVANTHALELVLNLVNGLPKCIKVSDVVADVVSRHNAFVNDLIARRLVKENKVLKVVVDDRVRVISDCSKGPAETEFVDKSLCVDDSSKYESFLADLISKPSDLPSVVTAKANIFMGAMENFSLNMNRHVSVMENIDKKLGRLDDVIDHQNTIFKTLSAKSTRESGFTALRSLGVTSPSVGRFRREKRCRG